MSGHRDISVSKIDDCCTHNNDEENTISNNCCEDQQEFLKLDIVALQMQPANFYSQLFIAEIILPSFYNIDFNCDLIATSYNIHAPPENEGRNILTRNCSFLI